MSGRLRHLPAVAIVAIAIIVIAASAAAAQTPTSASTAKSPATARHLEFDVGGLLWTPVSMGDQNVNLTAPSGAPVTIARTSSSAATSGGIEARMGFPVASRLSLEVAGSWSHVNFRTEVTGDAEANSTTASIGVSRFTAGGDVAWMFTRNARREIYAIGGASWMREISELSAAGVYDDGSIVDAGAGWKMLLRQKPEGRLKRIGLRFEGRVGIRTGGLSLDTKNVHFAPAFVGSLLIGS